VNISTPIRIAVGILVNARGEWLFGLRAPGAWEGHWELPGGKIEPGESAQDAVIRELHEELGVRVTGTLVFMHGAVVPDAHPERPVHADYFMIQIDQDLDLQALVHDELVWASPTNAPAPRTPGTDVVLRLWLVP
jgi:8-oxo-dGTP diphosphatase